jgi:hypothetical protein
VTSSSSASRKARRVITSASWTRIDKAGNVRILGGNTGNKVGESTYAKGSVLAVRRPPTPSESAVADEKAANDAQLGRDNAFAEQRDRLNQQLVDLLGDQATSIGDQASAARKLVLAEQSRLDAATENDVAEKKITAAQGDELIAMHDKVAVAKLEAIDAKRRLARMQEADQEIAQSVGFQLEDLQYRESIARSSGEHRDLQLQIVDLVYQEKLRHLEYLKAQAELVGNTEEAARLQAEINNLPAQQARATDQANRSTMSPGQQYLDSLPKSLGEVNDQLQRIEVQGLERLTDQLGDAALNAKSFGGFLRDAGQAGMEMAKQVLAELIKLALQMLIMKPLAQGIFGGQGGGLQPMGQTGGGWLGAIIGGIGAIFGGGSRGGGMSFGGDFSLAGSVGSLFNGGWHFASGTEHAPGGMAWVGENGPELVRMPRGSKVMTAANSRRMAANDGGIGSITFHMPIDATGADPAALARLEAKLNDFQQQLPGQIVSTFQDARQRFIIRG